MRRGGKRERFTAFQVGMIALVVLVIATFLAVTKDIPFTRPYELKAAFTNAPPIQRNQAVGSLAWTWGRSRRSSPPARLGGRASRR